MFRDNCAKQLQSIALSNNSVAHRIGDVVEDVQPQRFKKLSDKLFSILLDEATDSNKDAYLIDIFLFSDGMSAVELLFCKPIELKDTSLALFAILNDFMNEAYIVLEKLRQNMHRWCLFNVWKIPKYKSSFETKTFTAYLDKLHDPERSSGVQRNESW
ncbi:hypothetical protein AVEN_43274-1 [Araneus ventricosus]|uniref:DUF4371 domain-containing protein n=1 Tax=Araneus ventricosus TaxID=182803 RepID=A0A4Y2GDG8_ARAVE|nr:hypothetical protein AVEN_43274-1 [Araneus ventricosus]